MFSYSSIHHFLVLLREVWPEGDVFGSADVEPEEELELLKQILKANLPSTLLNCILMFPLVSEHLWSVWSSAELLISGSSPPEPVIEDEDDGVELEEEELESVQVSESEFDFLDFIKRWWKQFISTFNSVTCHNIPKSYSNIRNSAKCVTFLKRHITFILPPCRFATPSIVRPYLLLLNSYSKNAPHTNHCIARMLHRLAVNLKMDALLYQLSVFNLFNKILSDPAAAAYKVQSRNEKEHY